jgi:hypothetical protein
MESQDQQDSSQRADGASNSISSAQEVMGEESGTSQVSKFFLESPETFVAFRRNSLR